MRKTKITMPEAEMLDAIKYMTEVHGPGSISKFKESINTILFRCVLHSDPIDENTEKAIYDLYQINHLISKIEEYQLNSK